MLIGPRTLRPMWAKSMKANVCARVPRARSCQSSLLPSASRGARCSVLASPKIIDEVGSKHSGSEKSGNCRFGRGCFTVFSAWHVPHTYRRSSRVGLCSSQEWRWCSRSRQVAQSTRRLPGPGVMPSEAVMPVCSLFLRLFLSHLRQGREHMAADDSVGNRPPGAACLRPELIATTEEWIPKVPRPMPF